MGTLPEGNSREANALNEEDAGKCMEKMVLDARDVVIVLHGFPRLLEHFGLRTYFEDVLVCCWINIQSSHYSISTNTLTKSAVGAMSKGRNLRICQCILKK